jgi:PLP dependent protein
MGTIIENLSQIQQEINKAKQKSPYNQDVQIIAVTKSVSNERTVEAFEADIVHLGENRPEGLMQKVDVLGQKPIWHYIGTLQTRKVKQVLPYVDYIHSLDRLSLAEEINKRAEQIVKCFVQVNVAKEDSKHGLDLEEVGAFIEQLKAYPNIQVVGLMTMAPFTEDEQVLRHTFKQLKELQVEIQLKNEAHAPCTELSMGMSNDFTIAIEEGATFVRIGTALVG